MWLGIYVLGMVAFGLGACLGASGRSTYECADAAISDNPPKWWLAAIIEAKARKAVKELERSK